LEVTLYDIASLVVCSDNVFILHRCRDVNPLLSVYVCDLDKSLGS